MKEEFDMSILNATHIVEAMSYKTWWPNNENEILYRTDWMTIFYLILLVILLYGVWWIVFVPINWTRVCSIFAYFFLSIVRYYLKKFFITSHFSFIENINHRISDEY